MPTSAVSIASMVWIDGLLSSLGYEDDQFTEDQYDAATDYYDEQKTTLRIY